MQIDINPIIKSTGASLAIETEITAQDLGFSFQDYRLIRPLSLKGELVNTGDGILLLTGHLSAAYEGDCARCLEPVSAEIDLDLDEVFQPGHPSAEDLEREVYWYTGYKVDIGQAIRDNLLPHVLRRLVCREDCKGICPVCGANLNERDCDCDKPDDSKKSPFDQLKDLL